MGNSSSPAADVKTEVQAVPAAGVRSKNGGSSGLLIHFYTWAQLFYVSYIFKMITEAQKVNPLVINLT